jgi:lipoprotein-anchoring transpeptidase ErfK/SrfK
MPGHLYIPVKEIGKALNASVTEDEDSGNLMLDGHAVHEVRHMFDGSGIVALSSLREIGANVDWDNSAQLATIQYKDATAEVHQGDKTVIVDKSRQSLMAYQGARLVLATHVSTGREGHGTPNGHFAAGPAKERMHRSKLYNFAPMPWSVQVDGNVFIHGYTSVPNRPASHGCIRMPLTRGNPARYFFNWVDVGTPVTIQGVWSARYASRHGHSRLALRHRRHHHLSRYAARKHRRGRTRWASRHSAKSGQMTASQSHYTLGIARTTPTP